MKNKSNYIMVFLLLFGVNPSAYAVREEVKLTIIIPLLGSHFESPKYKFDAYDLELSFDQKESFLLDIGGIELKNGQWSIDGGRKYNSKKYIDYKYNHMYYNDKYLEYIE